MGRQWQVGALRVVNLQVTEPQERPRFVFAYCLDWSSSQGSSAEAWRNTTRAPANPKAQGSMGGGVAVEARKTCGLPSSGVLQPLGLGEQHQRVPRFPCWSLVPAADTISGAWGFSVNVHQAAEGLVFS